MKIVRWIVAAFLPWAAVDTELLRRRKSPLARGETIELEIAGDREVKRVRRKRRSVIPIGYRHAEKPVRRKVNHTSSKSRDVRDSNQRMIRRKFSNM